MKLEDIRELWEQDAEMSRTDLDLEALKIPKLHSKYWDIYIKERLVLKRYECELKQLKLEKFEFYTQGPTPEQFEKGWKLPASGKILKSEVNTYIDADQDVISMVLKIALQTEKVSFLEDVIKSISNRNFIIKSAVDWAKFKSGG